MADSTTNSLELRNLANRNAVQRDKAAEKRGKQGPERDYVQTQRSRRQAEADLESTRVDSILISGRLF